ncbi:hypothetical protein Fot_22045 [Forsythia ovata]|uniref:Uncharacterized protein n=1 Tax=Forsythia ovata TaxID=205694 RepID=A0ABD1UWN1_9LAMI
MGIWTSAGNEKGVPLMPLKTTPQIQIQIFRFNEKVASLMPLKTTSQIQVRLSESGSTLQIQRKVCTINTFVKGLSFTKVILGNKASSQVRNLIEYVFSLIKIKYTKELYSSQRRNMFN